jgi:uncharacterized RDD family membrane protein YckC
MVNYREASSGTQALAGLIDASLSLALVYILMATWQPEPLYSLVEGMNSTLLTFVVFTLYRILSLLFFRQTLGMRIFRVVLLNGEEQPLTLLEKSLAAIYIFYRGTSYYQV